MEVFAAIGGALASASVEALFEKLRSSELLKFARKSKLLGELKNWESLLMKIDALLEDAEEKQTTDRRVKLWLDELRDLTYDIEDILDEFSTEALKRRVKKENSHVPSFFAGLSPASLAFKHKMASNMKDITARLQLITAQEQTLNLTMIARERPNKPMERPPTTSLVDESHIYGRNDDKEALLQMLLRDEGDSNSISVIPIVGMGGIGKTTLAQLVYNDSKVKDYFDIRVWVCVSENFDVVTLTRRILRSITSEILDLKDLDFNLLQEQLKEELSQKKFLLILDDFWEEDYLQWDKLRSPFVAGAAGSKIVITTRKNLVASMAGNVPAYHVKGLSDHECLALLAHHALGAQNFDSHSSLKDIALFMVERCKGLPLAVKVLGGLLRSKPSPPEWELVLRSKMWNLQGTSTNALLPVLKLSYNDLPSYLKRCFVYCAIFPKDYEFDREELVLLWMAEGFLHFPQGGKQMEDIGIDCFEDLVSRSFFQLSSTNHSRYVMHDLISDLAQSIGREIYYNYENNFKGGMSNSKCEKVRHASFMFYDDNDLQEHAVFTSVKSLRTLLGFPIESSPLDYLLAGSYNSQFYNLLIQSKRLRVLSLTCPFIQRLPDSIEALQHIRHLNLSFTNIERLPESISSLFNLLTLLLRSCDCLKKLPDRIGNLVNLRHLDISRTLGLQEIPAGISMLTDLQTLSNFIVSKDCGATIVELKNLNNLRGILSIEELQNVTNLEDPNLVILKEKQGLEELVFQWNRRFENHHYGGNDMSVLESLEPHQNLKRLTIDSYSGSEFPSWMSDLSFPNLESLKLLGCKEVKFLPELHSLRHLFKLDICGCSSLVSFATTGLPCSLRTISVRHCGSLECFPIINTHDRHKSHLNHLEIYGCASLKNFATNFKLPPSLKGLVIGDCRNLFSLPDGLMTLDDNTNPCQYHLEVLRISKCQQLASFPAGKFPATLKTLEIKGCKQMTSISEAMFCNNMVLESIEIHENDKIRVFPSIDGLQHLKDLTIQGWVALVSFPKIGLCNHALQRLDIEECRNLLSIPSQMDTLLPSLQELKVSHCPCLVSLTQGGCLPKTLTSLIIRYCENLRQPIAEWGLHLLSSLKRLEVHGLCSADAVLFPDDGFCLLPNSLGSLVIGDFRNLESLGLGLRSLTCLYHLRIGCCPKLRYLQKEALPSSLQLVEIGDCPLVREHYKNQGEYPSSICFQWWPMQVPVYSISI